MLRFEPKRWNDLMRSFGLGTHLEMFALLHAAYSEPHRHYHNTAHIDACLRELDSARFLAEVEHEVDAALWFHDVVYDPSASDNERRSANIASQFFAQAGVADPVWARVHSHVMATMHNTEPTQADSRLVVDVDLSVLGQDGESYAEFERAIREEYKQVPWSLYRRKRAEILGSLLNRPFIYSTELFRQRYESRAHVNLQRAISMLSES
jgi:predicted metal-dependent HD superfamily phosphohydrolase